MNSSDYTTIELSKTGKHAGKYTAIVDAIDADLAQLNWRVVIAPNTQYAARSIYKDGKHIRTKRLHREIMENMLGKPIPDGYEVDHIDGDGLNNRRSNLRLATHAQNQQNRGKTSHNTSGYKGVTWAKWEQKWRARITVNGKQKFLGYFDSKDDAYVAYCEAADKLHGDYVNYGE